MYFRLRWHLGGTFELLTYFLDGWLGVLAWVTSLTGAGADERDAAATSVNSGYSGTGSGCSALSGSSALVPSVRPQRPQRSHTLYPAVFKVIFCASAPPEHDKKKLVLSFRLSDQPAICVVEERHKHEYLGRIVDVLHLVEG